MLKDENTIAAFDRKEERNEKINQIYDISVHDSTSIAVSRSSHNSRENANTT